MTSLTQVVARNTFVQVVGRFLSLIFGVWTIGLVMRYLGPEQYGYYSISLAFLQVVGIIVDFGLYLITLKYLGEIDCEANLAPLERQQKTNAVMQNIFTIRFVSGIFFYGLAFAVSLFFPYPLIVKIGILILSFSLLFSTLIQVLSAFYQKVFQANKIVLGELTGRIILLVLILFFIKFQLGFYFILGAFIASSGINFLILWRASRGLIDLRFKFDWTLGKKIFFQTWPIGLGIIFNTIYFKADTIILSLYRPAAEVGIYGACYRVFEILITFPPLFLGLIFAPITQAWLTKSIERYKNLLQKSFDFLVMFSLPLVFGTLVLGPQVMRLIGGEKFLVSGGILKVVILATGVLFVAELFKQVIVSLNLQRKALWFYLVTAIFSVIGYFIFIPRYSYWGAAWMTVASECLMFVFLLWMVWHESKFLPNLKFLWKSLVASLAMLVFLLIFASANLFFLITSGAIIYVLCLWSLGGINYAMIRGLLKRT